MVSLYDFLSVSAALFAVGVYGLVTKKNAMRLVFSVEILNNAANINFIAFNRYLVHSTRADCSSFFDCSSCCRSCSYSSDRSCSF